jgi:hypothetical protein
LRTSLSKAGALVLLVGLAIDSVASNKSHNLNEQITSYFNLEAADERRKTGELEAKIAPRDLSETEVQQISSRLKPFSGRTIVVQPYFNDPEGYRFLLVLTRTLKLAGIQCKPSYWYPDNTTQMMLLLGAEIDTPPEQQDFANALVDALKGVNVNVRPKIYLMAAGTALTLRIGVKPFETTGLLQTPTE